MRRSGGHLTIGKWCATMRVPGASARSFGSSSLIMLLREIGGDHRGLAQVGGEQIADDERDAIGDFGFVGNSPRQLDQVPGRARCQHRGRRILRGDDRDTPVTRPEIVDQIIRGRRLASCSMASAMLWRVGVKWMSGVRAGCRAEAAPTNTHTSGSTSRICEASTCAPDIDCLYLHRTPWRNLPKSSKALSACSSCARSSSSPGTAGGCRSHRADHEGHLQRKAGSLFPALHRLEQEGFIAGEWSVTQAGRRIKAYRLTAGGTAAADRREEAVGAHRVGDRPRP